MTVVPETRKMIPLALVAQANGWPYRRALDAVLTRQIEAERVNGRWYVIVRPEAPEAVNLNTTEESA